MTKAQALTSISIKSLLGKLKNLLSLSWLFFRNLNYHDSHTSSENYAKLLPSSRLLVKYTLFTFARQPFE